MCDPNKTTQPFLLRSRKAPSGRSSTACELHSGTSESRTCLRSGYESWKGYGRHRLPANQSVCIAASPYPANSVAVPAVLERYSPDAIQNSVTHTHTQTTLSKRTSYLLGTHLPDLCSTHWFQVRKRDARSARNIYHPNEEPSFRAHLAWHPVKLSGTHPSWMPTADL